MRRLLAHCWWASPFARWWARSWPAYWWARVCAEQDAMCAAMDRLSESDHFALWEAEASWDEIPE